MSMLTAPANVCLLCLSRSSKLPPSFRPARHAVLRCFTTKQRRKPEPARKALSPRVANPSSTHNTLRRSRPANEPAGPFAGLNRLEASIRQDDRSRTKDRKLQRDGRAPTTRERDARPRQSGYHALKMQQTLAAVSYGRRSAIKRGLDDVESFKQFPLLPIVQESITEQALKGLSDIQPTPIQRLAMPALLSSRSSNKPGMKQFLLAAETGSGKTLAYLLPIVDAIKRAEAESEPPKSIIEAQGPTDGRVEQPTLDEPHPTTGRPRAIILLPTAELVNQVGALAKSLSHTVKFRSSLISSSNSGKVIRNRLYSPTGIDLLISTPHLLTSIAESDPNILSRVTHLVADEADSLLDRSFAPLTSDILDRASPSLNQLILVSATIPRSLDGFLRRRFPDITRLTTPKLHSIPRRVQLGVIDVTRDPFRGNKSLAAADTIWSIGKEAAEHATNPLTGETDKEKMALKRVLVFVNERETADEVAEFLRSKGIDADALSRDTPEKRQAEILSAFTARDMVTAADAEAQAALKEDPDEKKNERKQRRDKETGFFVPPSRTGPAPKRVLSNTKVLVATDLGSRGIDTLAVRHVILYDVPHTSIDFIHRLGRTGRMGRRGRGIVLVGKNDRKDVVKEVREGMFMGKALV